MTGKRYAKDSLGDRMKGYENIPKNHLMLGVPHIVRLDMRAGHSFCRGFARPYDAVFAHCMAKTAGYLASEVPGCAIAYTQSDEISLVLFDSFANGFNCFFDGAVEKLCSITASMATLAFNKEFCSVVGDMESNRVDVMCDLGFAEGEVADTETYKRKVFHATFDSRTFSLPSRGEVVNYLIWRTQDATRNSVNMLAQSMFSHKELQGVNVTQAKEKVAVAGCDWEKTVSPRNKHGLFLCAVDEEIESGKPRKKWMERKAEFSGSAWYAEMSALLAESIERDLPE